MYLVVSKDGFNPFIPIYESIKKEMECKNCCYHGLSARAQAVVYTVISAVVLPFALLAVALMALYGTVNALFGVIARKKVFFIDAAANFVWCGKTILAAISVLILTTLSIPIPELTIAAFKMHQWGKYVYIPWCERDTHEIKNGKMPLKLFKSIGLQEQIQIKDIPKNSDCIEILAFDEYKQRQRIMLRV
jgi:hypothetical protein